MAAALTFTAPISPATADDLPRYTITVQGATVERPTLDQLELDAAEEGTTLSEAIDQYVADVVGPDWETSQPGFPDDIPSLPDLAIDGIHLWEIEDMELIAARDGVSLAQVIDSHGWQSDFLELADTIEARYPDQFSGAGIALDGPRTAWFGFKGVIPAEVVGLANSLPTRVDLTGNKGFSEAELVHLLNQAHDAVYSRADIAEVHGGYDIDTGVITIDAEPLVPAHNETARAQLEEQLQPSPSGNDSIRIEVRVMEQLHAGLDDGYVRGGGLLNGTGNCTAGLRHPASLDRRMGYSDRTALRGKQHVIYISESLRRRRRHND